MALPDNFVRTFLPNTSRRSTISSIFKDYETRMITLLHGKRALVDKLVSSTHEDLAVNIYCILENINRILRDIARESKTLFENMSEQFPRTIKVLGSKLVKHVKGKYTNRLNSSLLKAL
jgi:hypothetical protein